jgi:hypothetical protein
VTATLTHLLEKETERSGIAIQKEMEGATLVRNLFEGISRTADAAGVVYRLLAV